MLSCWPAEVALPAAKVVPTLSTKSRIRPTTLAAAASTRSLGTQLGSATAGQGQQWFHQATPTFATLAPIRLPLPRLSSTLSLATASQPGWSGRPLNRPAYVLRISFSLALARLPFVSLARRPTALVLQAAPLVVATPTSSGSQARLEDDAPATRPQLTSQGPAAYSVPLQTPAMASAAAHAQTLWSGLSLLLLVSVRTAELLLALSS